MIRGGDDAERCDAEERRDAEKNRKTTTGDDRNPRNVAEPAAAQRLVAAVSVACGGVRVSATCSGRRL